STNRDVSVRARFRKRGGPGGGGYGIIVRDQDPASRDGKNQDGAFYLLEVGDKGQVGVWRRDGSQWIDILPWTRHTAVLTGDAPNQLRVDNVGDHLAFFVNGVMVANGEDANLGEGGVGVFVGGDLNEVTLEGLTIQAPI